MSTVKEDLKNNDPKANARKSFRSEYFIALLLGGLCLQRERFEGGGLLICICSWKTILYRIPLHYCSRLVLYMVRESRNIPVRCSSFVHLLQRAQRSRTYCSWPLTSCNMSSRSADPSLVVHHCHWYRLLLEDIHSLRGRSHDRNRGIRGHDRNPPNTVVHSASNWIVRTKRTLIAIRFIFARIPRGEKKQPKKKISRSSS